MSNQQEEDGKNNFFFCLSTSIWYIDRNHRSGEEAIGTVAADGDAAAASAVVVIAVVAVADV